MTEDLREDLKKLLIYTLDSFEVSTMCLDVETIENRIVVTLSGVKK